MIKSYVDLMVYQKSYNLATKIFEITAKFPKEEKYSLIDQMRRSSRSISANIVEGWEKRHYENIFRRHLLDALGSCEETKLWLRFALDCHYIDKEKSIILMNSCDEMCKMLYSLFSTWKTYKQT